MVHSDLKYYPQLAPHHALGAVSRNVSSVNCVMMQPCNMQRRVNYIIANIIHIISKKRKCNLAQSYTVNRKNTGYKILLEFLLLSSTLGNTGSQRKRGFVLFNI